MKSCQPGHQPQIINGRSRRIKIANYVTQFNPAQPSQTSATVTSLTSLTSTSVDFYWVDGADGREVKFAFKVGGKSFMVKATFNVKRPTATVSVSTSTAQFANFGFGLGVFLGNPTQPGIAFTANVTIPSGFTGNTQWVQIWNKARMVRTSNGIWVHSNGTGLDSQYPYTSGNQANDSPGVAFDTFIGVKIDESYQMYLMFQPTGLSVPTIWVPLKVIN